jgi:hypothetical protein
MNKLILTLLIIVLMIPFSYARENQGSSALSFNKPAINDYKLIDVNTISAWVTNYGSIFRDPLTGNSGFEWPARGGVFAIYASGLWVGARVNGQPRVAIAEYSYEYKPGKIIDGVPDDPSLARYQVYKWLGGQTPDPEAVADGAPETIIGDQYLWDVYNDGDASYHVNMGTAPLKIEVQQSVFGFARTGPLGNTVFVKWLVVNKSGTNLEDTYITVWSDPDLGDSGDDFVGSDTLLSLGYCYNSSNTDGEYGDAPPAVGYDFFQGPIVPSPGDTAYVSGQMFLDYKNLPMTSYVYYNNNNANNGNPQTGAEVYNYMRAYWRDGTKITFGGTGTDPNSTPTNYMYTGDPEAGTGWLDSQPADRRFMMSTGPFTLDPFEDTNGNGKADVGEPGVQEIVVGVVIARGTSNLNSVTLLKQYDALAQLAYDLNFNLAVPPPSPVVDTTLMDRQIILNWENTDPTKGATYSEVESYETVDPLVPIPDPNNPPDTTYNFEGYLVYQYDFLDKSNGKLIGNFDLADGIVEVRDFVLDEGTGEYLEKLVWKGEDSGIKRYLSIKNDQFTGSRLINGKRYWFGVIAWGYNADSSPKMIQSPEINGLNFLEISPQSPSIGTSYAQQTEGNIISSTKEGESDGVAFAVVVDPTRVTGHDYKVDFDTDASGNIFWRLMDEATGNTVIDSIYHQSSDSTDTAYPVADGIQWKVLGPPAGINLSIPGPYGPGQGEDGWNWEDGTSSRWISGYDWGGPTFFGGMSNGSEFFGSDVGPAGYVSVEMRWAGTSDRSDTTAEGLAAASQAEYPDRWSKAVVYWRDQGYAVQPTLGDIPFALYDVWASPERRLKIAFVEDANAGSDNLLWDMGWDGSAFPDMGGREYIFMLNDDYDTDYTDYLNGTLDGTYNGAMYDIWPQSRSRPYLQGTWNMQVYASRVNGPGVSYTFRTDTAVTVPIVNDINLAKDQIDKINVFPNPYYGTHSGERLPTVKWVEFTHLPPTCTIRIFNLAGALVRTLERSGVTDRTWERWDLHNESELPVASGLYIYHIKIPNVGEKVGKLAVFLPQERLDTF